MFQINRQKKGEDLIIVTNKTGSTTAEISLDKGGSISNLFINNKQIITDNALKTYIKNSSTDVIALLGAGDIGVTIKTLVKS